jgi:23S rRNA (guanosine2251-2'-O)-methyltransferase
LGGTQIEGRQAVRELLLAGRRRVHQVFVASDVERGDAIDDIIMLAGDRGVPVRRVPRRDLERDRVVGHHGRVALGDLAQRQAGWHRS